MYTVHVTCYTPLLLLTQADFWKPGGAEACPVQSVKKCEKQGQHLKDGAHRIVINVSSVNISAIKFLVLFCFLFSLLHTALTAESFLSVLLSIIIIFRESCAAS